MLKLSVYLYYFSYVFWVEDRIGGVLQFLGMIKFTCASGRRYTRYDMQNFKIKKGGKDQESIQSSTTPDPGHHMGK